MVEGVLPGHSTAAGFLILLGLPLLSERLYIFGLPGAICIQICYVLYFIFKWAEPGGIGPWPGWLTIVLQCCDIAGWVIGPVKLYPEMTCIVSSWLFNPMYSIRERNLWIGRKRYSIGALVLDLSLVVDNMKLLHVFLKGGLVQLGGGRSGVPTSPPMKWQFFSADTGL